MSWASDVTTCPQCRFPEASDELNCSTYQGYVFCPRCGYMHRYGVLNGGTEGTEIIQVTPGYGVLCRGKDTIATYPTAWAVSDAELSLHQADEELVYLTRWNGQKVELLIGEYPLTEAEIEEETV